jgi:hypothetical protein
METCRFKFIDKVAVITNKVTPATAKVNVSFNAIIYIAVSNCVIVFTTFVMG